MSSLTLQSVCLAFVLAPCVFAQAADKLKFNRDIRPILSDKCFHCHGNDPNKREAKMRLDIRESALEKDAFVPGNADASEMIKRILTTDPDDHMPPAKAKIGDLTAAEIATLKQWVNEGAEYEAHWAFNPLKVPGSGFPVLPQSRDIAGSIDEIVSAGLKERGLQLLPEASAETLVRRLSFDITGLPPKAEEVLSFGDRTNRSDRTYETYVEKLLASPHHGERMAVDWLDVSRYADSYGFQVDRDREVWP